MARSSENIDFGSDSVMRILLRLAPPVMPAQLIQALYNIVDSFFVGKCSATGLTALSIIYPLQLLMIAIAVGTGVGINTLMAHYMGIGKRHKSDEAAGTGVFVAGFVAYLRRYILFDNSILRVDVHPLGRRCTRRRSLRQDSLRFQLWAVF